MDVIYVEDKLPDSLKELDAWIKKYGRLKSDAMIKSATIYAVASSVCMINVDLFVQKEPTQGEANESETEEGPSSQDRKGREERI